MSNTQFKTDKTRSEERPAKRRYVLQLNCMLDGCLTAQLTATLKNRIYFYKLKLKTNSLDSFSKGIFYYNGYLNMKNKFLSNNFKTY